MGAKGKRARGAGIGGGVSVDVPRAVAITETAGERPTVIHAGPVVEDPASVKRVLSVGRRSPHDEDVRRVLAYRRVSTMEQMRVGNSLDMQDEEIRRYCQYARLPDPVDFEETESGGAESEEKREKIAALLKAVRRGDLVLVSKIDRFSRDIVFTISAVREIIKRGARFLSLAERFDASTPEGETQMALWASIAQMERARIRERTEGNRKRLRAQGKFVEGQPPFGYVRARPTDGAEKPRRLDVDPSKAAIVREMFDLCLKGESAVAISKHLRAKYRGVAAFGRAWVLWVLKNRVYAGQLALTSVRPGKGRVYTQLPADWVDAHEPIISVETWIAAQEALIGRRSYGVKAKPESSTRDWLIRGLARCALCGTIIAARPTAKNSRYKHSGYYACSKRYVPGEDGIRCLASKNYRREEMDEHIARLAVRHMKNLQTYLMRPPPPAKDGPNFAGQRAHWQKKKKELVSLLVDGAFSVDDIKAKARQIDQRLAEIDAEESEHAAEASADTVENRRRALAWVEMVAKTWDTLPPQARRAALAAMSESLTLSPDGPSFQWCDAAAMAVRHAEGKLPAFNGEAIPQPPRPKRRAPGEKSAEGAPSLPPADGTS
jgi:DNA invertase Pin-like site-specific DNA recombinase